MNNFSIKFLIFTCVIQILFLSQKEVLAMINGEYAVGSFCPPCPFKKSPRQNAPYAVVKPDHQKLRNINMTVIDLDTIQRAMKLVTEHQRPISYGSLSSERSFIFFREEGSKPRAVINPKFWKFSFDEEEKPAIYLTGLDGHNINKNHVYKSNYLDEVEGAMVNLGLERRAMLNELRRNQEEEKEKKEKGRISDALECLDWLSSNPAFTLKIQAREHDIDAFILKYTDLRQGNILSDEGADFDDFLGKYLDQLEQEAGRRSKLYPPDIFALLPKDIL